MYEEILCSVSENEDKTVRWLSWVTCILDKVGAFTKWINIAGVVTLFSMVCLTFVDVVMRYVFNQPIEGVYDFTSVMLIVIVFLGVAYVHNQNAHVAVDVIINRLSPKSRTCLGIITDAVSIGIMSILVWRSSTQFLYFLTTGARHSQNIEIPSAPFAAIVVLGSALFLLLLMRDILKKVADALRLQLKGYQWLFVFGTPTLIAVLSELWMQPTLWRLSAPVVGLIGTAFSLLFMFAAIPVAVVLILTGFLFIGHIAGASSALNVLGAEVYRTPSSYTWSVIPFFVLMGYICLSAGFGRDLYYAAYSWFGRLPGGLAITTIGACTAFAAIVGSGIAPTVTMGSVALPEMRKYKYDDRLATGAIVGGASLGPIIPPSTLFIIYGILTQQSIGRLFIAGIVPGLILSVSFMVYVCVHCRINPALGPRGERSSWTEKVASLRMGSPVGILFLLVIGGLYAGVFSSTEAGAIGCGGALILALLMRRLTWQSFKGSLLEAGKTSAMVLLMLIGGTMFSRFIAFADLPNAMTQFVAALAVPPAAIVLVILLIFFILGFFIEIIPMMLVGVPVVHPLVVALGYDPTWFTVMLTIIIGSGAITPPMGINLFVLKGVSKDTSMSSIYLGALPFSLATLSFVGLIFVFPSIVTWLPDLLY